MRIILALGLLITAMRLFSQDSTAHQLGEVTVTGYKEEGILFTSTNIRSISAGAMHASAAFNIADGLSRVPGISQLSTGVAISKPVIRGLYGSRLLTLLSGLRFDNQQWQDEHGLGLSAIGVDRVEVIKGPMSILYGTDAVGGVLNVIEENPAPSDSLMVEVNSTTHSNTLGTATDIGIMGNRNNKWWRIRVGAESHGDYSDGASNRVLNSRFGGYYLKVTYGYRKGRFTTVNNYNFSYNNFGFIMEDILSFIKPDGRYSRSAKGPHHIVMFNVFSSQNTLQLKKSFLKVNAGFQANNRMEDEGGGHISLNMLLSTLLYNLQWSKTIHPRVEFILSQGSTLENNTNFGARKIIPDAWMAEFSGSGFLKVNVSRNIIAEFGLGVNSKWIKTILTPGVNSADKLIAPFSKNWISANGLAGLVFNPTSQWNIKLNASSGFRAPNLAELASNGLHEGIFTYEIGDPNLKSEQNINAAADVSYVQDWVSFAVAGFYNRFYNYIYLQPTNRDFYGFPVFLFKQQNAQLYGGEFEWKLTPQQKARGLEFNLGLSTVIGKTDNGNYLPYIPATRLRSLARYEHDISQKVKAVFGSIGFDYVFQQSKPAPHEKPTGSYYLLSASAGARFILKKGTFTISLTGNNLLGAKYFDHLSRFKNYGIYNMGRDIVLRLSVPLLFNYSTKPQNKK